MRYTASPVLRRDVMLKTERLEVLEEAAAQVVDHALAGIDLHLRGVGGHELVDDLQQHPGDHDQDEQRRPGCRRSIACSHPRHGSGNGCAALLRTLSMTTFSGHGCSAPRAIWTASSTDRTGGLPAVRTQERQHPGEQRRLSDGRHAHGRVTGPVGRRGAPAAAGGVGTGGCRMVEARSAGRGSSRRSRASPARRRDTRRASASPNVIRPSSLMSRMMPSGPTARTWPL